MLPQLAAGAILTGTIMFVYWWFRPPQITPVSEECRQHWRKKSMQDGDNPSVPPSSDW